MTALKKKFFNKYLLIVPAILLAAVTSFAQDVPPKSNEKEKFVSADSNNTTTVTIDSTKHGVEKKVRVYKPKVAALRSAILPGLGQIYNKKYWKLPIVYAALGISGGVFIYNLKNYKDTRFAYQAIYKASQPGATAADSVDYFKIKPPLQRYSLSTLQYYRNSFRRDIDYSALIFIILWGLNVVDATVDAHLKAFDVSPDLSLRFKPGRSRMAGTTGLSLVFNIGKNINPRLPMNTFIN
jgi:Family of unknown function (DUF5683)